MPLAIVVDAGNLAQGQWLGKGIGDLMISYCISDGKATKEGGVLVVTSPNLQASAFVACVRFWNAASAGLSIDQVRLLLHKKGSIRKRNQDGDGVLWKSCVGSDHRSCSTDWCFMLSG